MLSPSAKLLSVVTLSAALSGCRDSVPDSSVDSGGTARSAEPPQAHSIADARKLAEDGRVYLTNATLVALPEAAAKGSKESWYRVIDASRSESPGYIVDAPDSGLGALKPPGREARYTDFGAKVHHTTNGSIQLEVFKLQR